MRNSAGDYLIPAGLPAVASIPYENDVVGVKKQLKALYQTWRGKQVQLEQARDGSRVIQFAGITLAGIGAIANSHADVAKIGLGAAGSAALTESAFNVQGQAGNYKVAADTVACIERRISAVPSDFWGLFSGGIPNGPRGDAISAGLTSDDYNVLLRLFSSISDSISGVVDRLITDQLNSRISLPTQAEVIAALSQSSAAGGAAARAGARVAGVAAAAAPPPGVAAAPASNEYMKVAPGSYEIGLQLPTEIKKCIVVRGKPDAD
ncbi:hypothetical protein MW290_32275 (plasmid) [Aquincola tertiaricarbonis]|uniref:Uncharacterized protein n=2 Tax=Aquincola tertiaricarbonis TaxID=391953 RepID=A0ABY4SF68_AQUTE|nr:hypothetical protein MW290_32275 [Aquincola tertiaricarbonis]